MDFADLTNRFAYHQPKDDAVAAKHASVRKQCIEFAYWLNNNLPDSREKSVAITKLEEVMMWANASIARNE